MMRQQRLKGAAVATDLSVYLVDHPQGGAVTPDAPRIVVGRIQFEAGVLGVVQGCYGHGSGGVAGQGAFGEARAVVGEADLDLDPVAQVIHPDDVGGPGGPGDVGVGRAAGAGAPLVGVGGVVGDVVGVGDARSVRRQGLPPPRPGR